MAITTTSPTKLFTQVKHFSAANLSDLDDAVNTFITGTLDDDPYDYFTVILGSSYFDGSNYVCAISYTRFENDSDWSSSLA
jgi:hypothetical protein